MNMYLDIATNIGWLDTLLTAVNSFVNPILIVAAIAGVLYAIVVGVKFIKAEDKSQRDEAKQKLITVIIGVVVTIVLVILFYWLANNIGPNKPIDPSNWGQNLK